jgi:hypothetical protein
MFDRSRTRFHEKNSKKAAQDFHRAVSKIFDRVKSVALNIRLLARVLTGCHYTSCGTFFFFFRFPSSLGALFFFHHQF